MNRRLSVVTTKVERELVSDVRRRSEVTKMKMGKVAKIGGVVKMGEKKIKLEERMSKQVMQGLKEHFNNKNNNNKSKNDINNKRNNSFNDDGKHISNNGNNNKDVNNNKEGLRMEEFADVICELMSHDEIEEAREMYKRIDVMGNGKVTWSDVCAYMQAVCSSVDGGEEEEEPFDTPIKVTHNNPHPSEVVRVLSSGKEGSLTSISSEGKVVKWRRGLQAVSQKLLFKGQKGHKFVTDMCFMNTYNKIIVTTGDREVQFYDIITLQSYCQLNQFSSMPLTLFYKDIDKDICIIAFGDAKGFVNLIYIASVSLYLRTWSKTDKHIDMPTLSIYDVIKDDDDNNYYNKKMSGTKRMVKFMRIQLHQDWVTQIHLLDKQLISTSCHDNTALVLCNYDVNEEHNNRNNNDAKNNKHNKKTATKKNNGDKINESNNNNNNNDKDSASTMVTLVVNKGVKCFHVCAQMLATGGTDRMLRVWDIRVLQKPLGVLQGHEKAIIMVTIKENKIFSVSKDACVFVWTLTEMVALSSCRPRSLLLTGQLLCCCSDVNDIVMVTDKTFNLLKQKCQQAASKLLSGHSSFISCLLYCCEYDVIITVSKDPVIRVWASLSGSLYSLIHHQHNNITSAELAQNRLVTGGADWTLRIWNIHNSQLLFTIVLDCSTEVTSLNSTSNYFMAGTAKRTYIFPKELNTKPIAVCSCDYVRHITACTCGLILICTDSSIDLWNLHTSHLLTTLHPQQDHRAPTLRKAVFLPGACTHNINNDGYGDEDGEGNLLMMGDGEVVVWRVGVAKTEVVASACVSLPGSSLTTFTCHGDLVIIGDNMGHIGVYELQRKTPKLKKISVWRAHTQEITCVTIRDVTNTQHHIRSQNDKNTPQHTQHFNDTNLLNLINEKTKKNIGHVTNDDDFINLEVTSHSKKMNSTNKANNMKDPRIVNKDNIFVVTSSQDGDVRVWNGEGQFVGDLGQKKLWCLDEPSSFAHPLIPHSILIHPSYLPNFDNIIYEDEEENDDDDDMNVAKQRINSAEKQRKSNKIEESEEEKNRLVEEMLMDEEFLNANGKRLLNALLKTKHPHNHYQQLNLHPLTSPIYPTFPHKLTHDDKASNGADTNVNATAYLAQLDGKY